MRHKPGATRRLRPAPRPRHGVAASPRSARWSRCRSSARRSISRSGRPTRPGASLASRADQPLQSRSLDALVAQVEAHLEKNPNDGRGWEVIAPVYLRYGRYDDAVKARRNALRLNGTTAEREADLG